MRLLLSTWPALGLAVLLAVAPGALADGKDKKQKGKKDKGGASVTVTLAVGTLLVVDAIDGLLN